MIDSNVVIVIGFLLILLVGVGAIIIRRQGTLTEKMQEVAQKLQELQDNPAFIKSGEAVYDRASEPVKLAFETLNKALDLLGSLNIPVFDPVIDEVEDLVDELTDGVPLEGKTVK